MSVVRGAMWTASERVTIQGDAYDSAPAIYDKQHRRVAVLILLETRRLVANLEETRYWVSGRGYRSGKAYGQSSYVYEFATLHEAEAAASALADRMMQRLRRKYAPHLNSVAAQKREVTARG